MWIVQTYLIVPAFVGVYWKVSSFCIVSEAKSAPSVAVTLCGSRSLFVQTIF